MKKIFLPLLFLIIVSNGTLPIQKAIIYHSASNENITLTLNNYQRCISVIDCGSFKDSVVLGDILMNYKNERVLSIQTHGQDIYGWSDGEVTYTIR